LPYNTAQNILHIYTFLKMSFQIMAFQQRQHGDALGCRTLWSELINMFVFDVLQICSGRIRFDKSALRTLATPWLWAWWLENVAHMG
jgi:hypothetical protein